MIHTRRISWFAIEWRRMALLLPVALFTFVATSHAQPSRVSRAELVQIVDAALQGVVPPEGALSQIPLAKRTLRFDHQRTMAAFGIPVPAGDTARLALRRVVLPGTAALIADCDQMGSKPCDGLGLQVYITVAPISIGAQDGIVRLNVTWASHHPSRFVDGTPPTLAPRDGSTSRSFLTGFSAEVHLRRSASGAWQFVRVGTTAVG